MIKSLAYLKLYKVEKSAGDGGLNLKFKSRPPLFIDSGKRKYYGNNPSTQIRLIHTGKFNSGLISHPVHQITFLGDVKKIKRPMIHPGTGYQS
jgi:hypothetical protein